MHCCETVILDEGKEAHLTLHHHLCSGGGGGPGGGGGGGGNSGSVAPCYHSNVLSS